MNRKINKKKRGRRRINRELGIKILFTDKQKENIYAERRKKDKNKCLVSRLHKKGKQKRKEENKVNK